MAIIDEERLRQYDLMSDAEKAGALAEHDEVEKALITASYDKWKASPKAKSIHAGRPQLAETVGRNLVEGSTGGHSGEVLGAAETMGIPKWKQALLAYGAAINPVVPMIAGSSALLDVGRTLYNKATNKDETSIASDYQANRKVEEDRLNQSKEDSPVIGGGTELVGGVGASLLPLGSAKTLVGAGLQGLGYGAVQGAGKSEADLTEGGFGQYVKDTAIGGVVGVPMGMLGHGVAGVINNKLTQSTSKFSEAAALKAYKSLGPSVKDLRNTSTQQQIEIGRRLLDEGAVKFGRSAEGVAEALDPIVEKAGKLNDEAILRMVDKKSGLIQTVELIDELKNTVMPQYTEAAYSKSLINSLQAQIDRLEEIATQKPALTFLEAEKLIKRPMQAMAKSGEKSKSEATQGLQELASGAREFIENEAMRIAPDEAPAFMVAKKRFGDLKGAENIAKETSYRAGAKTGDLDPVVTAIAAAQAGGPQAAVPGLIARSLMKTRGASSQAVIYKALEKALGPDKAAQVMTKLLLTQGLPTLAEGVASDKELFK